MKSQMLKLALLTILMSFSTLVACQKSNNNSEDSTPSAVNVLTYNFTPAEEQAYRNIYNMSGNNSTNTGVCATGAISYNSRTEFCNLLINESRNNGCAAQERRGEFERTCRSRIVSGTPPTLPGSPTIPPASGPAQPIPPAGSTSPTTPGVTPVQTRVITCTVNRVATEKKKWIFGPFNVQTQNVKYQSFMWNQSQKQRFNLRLKSDTSLRNVVIDMTPVTTTEAGKIKLSYTQKETADDKKFSKIVFAEGVVDSDVIIQVSDSEDKWSDEVNYQVIKCSVGNAANTAVSFSSAVCEGTAQLPGGKSVSISQPFSWSGSSSYRVEIPLKDVSAAPKKNDDELTDELSESLYLQVDPQNVALERGALAQTPMILLALPALGQDIESKVVMSLTRGTSTFEHKESSGFSVKVSCKGLP